MATRVEYPLADHIQQRAPGFVTSLFNTIMLADSTNLAKLELGFPEEVAAVRRYREEPEFSDYLYLL